MAGQGIGIALALGLDVDERDASVLRRPQVVGFTADANLSHRMRGQRFETSVSHATNGAADCPFFEQRLRNVAESLKRWRRAQRVQRRVETLRPQLVQRLAHATLDVSVPDPRACLEWRDRPAGAAVQESLEQW